ncbi:GNAT family N-acetyltransferase [Arthrobacter sp. AD-310]
MAPARPLHADLSDLESAMDAAWPASERHEADGWVLRAAGGVTQRANSIWPRQDSDEGAAGFPAMLRGARSWYRSRRLPVIFQVLEDGRMASLTTFLDGLGFTRQSETLVMTRGPWPGAPEEAGTADNGRTVELSGEPSDEWLHLWWDIDGRGGDDALATARDILTGCLAVYALVRDDDGRPAAVGRLALPNGPGRRGGIYCMATHKDSRRQGYGTAVLRALLSEGAARDLDGYWLLVTAANDAAQALYSAAGFQETARYHYRQDPPRRALAGC